MAELIQSIQDMLKEETWTRAAIGSYTENNLRELSALVTKAEEEKCTKEVYDICNEQLSHSKDSIIALYFCGIIDLKNNSLDYTSLETLVDIFQKNHKENVVTYLCENILADEKYLAEDGNPDLTKMDLIVYDPIHHGYIQLGNRVGNAFSDGKALK